MPEVTIPGVGVVHFPYDMPPDQIATQAKRLYAEVQAKGGGEAPLTLERQPAGTPSAIADNGGWSGWGGHAPGVLRDDPRARAGRFAIDNLPAIAAGGAALATGGASIPATVGIAALAGGAGSAARHGLQRVEGRGTPMTAEELGLDVVKEGALQGGMQALGAGIAKAGGAVMRPIGRALYGKALAPSKAVLSEFPDVVETGVREGFNVTPKGAAAAEAAGKASAGTARELVKQSAVNRPGLRLKVDALEEGLNPLRAQARALPEANVALGQIDEFAKNLQASHPKGFTAEELLNTKQAADRAGRAAHKAAQVGNLQAGPTAEMNKAVADTARATLNRNVPGLSDINARTRSLMGIERALDEATARPTGNRLLTSLGAGGVSSLASGGAGVPAAALAYAAQSPRVIGRTGLLLGRTGRGTGQLPADLFRAALLEALGGAETPGAQP
jgi:hypothetical protein